MSPRVRSSMVWAVGGVALVALLRPLANPPGITGVDPGLFWARKLHTEERQDIVLAGDSRTLQGLSPNRMRQALGPLRIANFGFASVGFEASYLRALERLVSGSARPTLVLGITTAAITFESAAQNDFLYRSGQGSHPLWRTRLEAWFRPIEWPRLLSYQTRRRVGPSLQHYGEDGWIASDATDGDLSIEEGFYRRKLNPAAVDHDLVRGLVHRIQGWRARGIQVVAFRFPAEPHLLALEDSLTSFDWVALARQIGAAGGLWLDLSAGGPYASYDGSHLSRTGALRLSAFLAQRLARGLRVD